jgi:acetylornithine deacetylase/succinyl-diaminopimelate desuccinylase-like protein
MSTSVHVPSDLEDYLEANEQRIRQELDEFLRIPSVSARSEQMAGMTTEVHETPGHPIVLGQWRNAPKGAPTVLIYGHYDVQPADPLDLWDSPPFEPTVRDGRIYARGAVDDKGQLFLHVKAIEAHLSVRKSLPVNVMILAEGEEETGSDHLASFVEENAERLRCDGVVISDSAMFAPGIPSVLFALRGMAYFQIDVQGPAVDLHSGSYGGAVVNPATALARIIASLHDENWRVAIPGFYDKVREWEPEVRRQLGDLPFSDETLREETGAPSLGGEAGYETLERLWARPTCEVNGMLSGYTGEGAKTVLPSVAMAKVSCRLVPDQTPQEIEKLMDAHVRKVAPKGVTVKIRHLHGGMPWRAELGGPLFDAAGRALEAAFGRQPVMVGEGGSIPVVSDFARILDAPILLLGFGLPGENAHAPNEWMSEENFSKGMRAVATLWDEYGRREMIGA